jgi:hypothetical protein
VVVVVLELLTLLSKVWVKQVVETGRLLPQLLELLTPEEEGAVAHLCLVALMLELVVLVLSFLDTRQITQLQSERD